MLSDFRFALRQLRHAPGFTAVAVFSLALGIGGSTAIFTLVNDVMLRPLPVRAPGELVLFRTIEGPGGRMSRAGENNGSIDPATGRSASTSFSLLTFERFRVRQPAAAEVFAFAPFNRIQFAVEGRAEAGVFGQLVSGNYHAALGVPAILGRTLLPADDQPGAPPAAVISHRFWESRFGSAPSVVGQVVQVNRVPVTIVGVTPRGFGGAMQVGESADLTLPLAHHLLFEPERAARLQPSYWWVRIMGRLAPGVTPAQARASLEPVLQETAREGWLADATAATGAMPEPPTLAADPGGQGENDRRRQFYTGTFRILTGFVALVLLAACTNVANLLLARGALRRRELALRLALGAGRGRVVRQLFAESVLLAALGAALGTLFAWWGRGLLRLLPQFNGQPLALDLPLDARVLGFTSAVAALTALVFGLVPALRATRLDLTAEFQGGPRQLGAGARSRLGSTLMAVQIAVSFVLLVGAGLFVRTVENLKSTDLGFDGRQLLLFRLDATAAGHAPERHDALHAQVLERIASLPGVSGATYARVALLTNGRANRRIAVPGYTPAPGENMGINLNGLAPNFFATLGMPLLAGRDFTPADAAGAPRVAVVSQAFARKFFGGGDPVGRSFGVSAFPNPGFHDVAIVGVVRDAKYTGLRETGAVTFYVPAAQMPEGIANYMVRGTAAPAALAAAIRAVVRDIDPAMPVIDLRTHEEQLDRRSAQERLLARLAGLFGAVALALACVGLYGLVSYRVLRRTGEIGLRMALGALPRRVAGAILGESLRLVGCGLLLGALLSWGATRWIASLLFGLSATDPATYAGAALVLVVVACAATLLPARRAARVEPIIALRTE